jgi:hypothetical protein
MNMKNIKSLLAFTTFLVAACSFQGLAIAQHANDPKFNKMMKDGFRAEGIAGLDRIDQDATQKFCSDPVFSASKQGEKMREKIQKINMKVQSVRDIMTLRHLELRIILLDMDSLIILQSAYILEELF